MIICSTATFATVPYVLEMARSAKQHYPHAKIVLALIEEEIPDMLTHSPWIDTVLLAKQLPIPDFNRFIFKMTSTMSLNTIKAQLLQHLIHTDEQADILVFADCYTQFFGPLPEVMELLESRPIVLIPHLVDVHATDDYERELMLLNDGTFFAGFIALKRTDESKHFLDWWSDKLNRDIRDPYASDFFDQKWLNFANVFFNAAILKHPGYQLAFWNFHEPSRRITHADDQSVQLAANPLRLVNFGNENNQMDYYLKLLPGKQHEAFLRLRDRYAANVKKQDLHGYLKHVEWSYDRYTNKEKIALDIRLNFRSLPDQPANPFEYSNAQFNQMFGREENER
ncbi:hypothetical protein [Paenibacillus protaetiae]|uniref:Glycosyl transferase n=1 Tax=Paenibacillus protaetiae TaxID=2509456 RepID=A0A4P6F1D6_9BACL|nr:hypothetical protein [Paenibacillus protaetiae]QAY66847.1 hypothetical protein ET464_11035 [Paenibacillus protaetiae]